jgi:SagB-type dehydrogenase family enzyme
MMKKILSLLALGLAITVQAQNVTLPRPNQKATSTSMVETLAQRHSVREFASTPLSLQELSNLCWAACGMSRDDNHRTAPTARNLQEIRLFVFMEKAVYEYDAKANILVEKAKGDHRGLIAGTKAFKQDFAATAPVSLLMVIDFDKFGSMDPGAIQMGCVDAGIVCENINLYCQSVGLATVPRATHDKEGIRKLLGLTEKHLPIMNNPVGKPKSK